MVDVYLCVLLCFQGIALNYTQIKLYLFYLTPLVLIILKVAANNVF
jgi:hypothetical protein